MKQAPIERRSLRFAAISEITADLDQLESAHRAGSLRQLGHWPPGSIFEHLAHAAVCSFDGFDGFTFPLHLRLFAPLVKRRMLTTSFPAGFKLSKDGESKAWKRDVPFDEGLSLYRTQIARMMPGNIPNPAMNQRHPSFGRMTPADWVLYQLRHAELHLSFLQP